MPVRGDSSFDCREARDQTRAFLSGRGPMAQRADWRAHLAACRGCDEHYRETVEMLSRLQRARKEPGALSAGLDEPMPAPRRAGFSFFPPPAAPGTRPRKRRRWLGWAIPMFGLLAFATLGPSGPARTTTTARTLEGEVEAAGHRLAREDEPRALGRGAKLAAAAGARVEIADGVARLRLSGEGALAFEGSEPLRVRLYGGRLSCFGPCTISTALGVIECGSCSLDVVLDEHGLALRPEADGVTFRDGRGVRTLAAGVEQRIGSALVPAPAH